MKKKKFPVYLSLGSNLGDRKKQLAEAKQNITTLIGLILKESQIYETEPWGFMPDSLFLNQVVLCETFHRPLRILEMIHRIETSMGRKRKSSASYESRTIDIDILYYDDLVYSDDSLIIPHPLLETRKFALMPLTELAPDLVHPVLEMTSKEMLDRCADTLTVTPINSY